MYRLATNEGRCVNVRRTGRPNRLQRRHGARGCLEQPQVLQAIGRPRNGLEAFRLNRPAVDDASAERAIVDAFERVTYLLEHGGIELRFCKILGLRLVRDTGIADIAGRVQHLLSRAVLRTRDASGEALFKVEQASHVILCVHVGLFQNFVPNLATLVRRLFAQNA